MTWDNQGRIEWVSQMGAGLVLAPYFFHKTRVQKSVEEICTLFFSRAPPRIAQERRLGFRSGSFTSKGNERSESRLRDFIEAC